MLSGRRNNPATKAAVAGALSVGAGVLGFGSMASAAEPSQQELLEQIQALQAKVEQMEARQAPQTQAAPKATEAQATIGSVLDDAERRSNPQFLQAGSGGLTAGYVKNKFIIQDESGDFLLNPNLQFQLRHVANFRSDDSADGTGDDAAESGFEIRRLKFAFDGNAFGKDLTYKFQWATNRSNGTPVLDDAWVRWSMGNAFGEASKDLALRVGQFKDPTFHEEITSSKRQLAVDRSLMNEVLAGGQTDWVQGVALIWDDGPEGRPLRAEIGFTDGLNTDNTNFVDAGGSAFYGAANPDWGAFARVEYLAMGNWKQYDDFTAMGNTEDLLVIGGGATYSENGNTAGGGDTLLYTIDAQYETGRLGLYAAYVGAYSEPGFATDGGLHDMGFLVQAGYMLDREGKWEVFGRYDSTLLDDARFTTEGNEDSFHELTLGLNYYIKGHAAKLTIDGTWLPNGAPNNQDGIGVLDPDGDDDQFMIRTQFQLLI
jgi:hypothetical protein